MSDELSNLLRAHGEAQGKADLYAAVGDFLKKYGEKLNRQYNESQKAYKKTGESRSCQRCPACLKQGSPPSISGGSP